MITRFSHYLFVCALVFVWLSCVCWLKKESQRTNQSRPHNAAAALYSATRQQQGNHHPRETHSTTTTATHRTKRSFSSGSCFINLRLDFSSFSFFFFLSDSSRCCRPLSSLNHARTCETCWPTYTIYFTSNGVAYLLFPWRKQAKATSWWDALLFAVWKAHTLWRLCPKRQLQLGGLASLLSHTVCARLLVIRWDFLFSEAPGIFCGCQTSKTLSCCSLLWTNFWAA